MTPKLWRVIVDCRREAFNDRLTREVLLAASDASEAMDAGAKWAEETACMSSKWISFEARSCATVKLPMEMRSAQ